MIKNIIKLLVLPVILFVALPVICFGQTGNELPLPNVPAELREPQARAEYIISHFWDEMDFSDTLRSRNRAFMEQNTVNWLSLLPHVQEQKLSGLINTFLEQVAADSIAFRLVVDIVEQYLFSAYSPLHNEGLFIVFFEQLLKSKALDKAEQIRPSYLLKTAKKNRPGMKAADFKFIAKEKSSTLHSIKAERLLLMFYAPNCKYCKDVIKEINGSPLLQTAINNGELKVLAVYAEGNRELWEATKTTMPHDWIVGFETGRVMEQELYAMPVMPVVYMLDKDKKVLLKETTVGKIVEAIEKL